MDDSLDPLAHRPDPAQRYTVLAVTQDTGDAVVIYDEVEQRGLVLTVAEALQVAADINREIARIVAAMTAPLEPDDDTQAEWEQRIAAWRKNAQDTDGRTYPLTPRRTRKDTNRTKRRTRRDAARARRRAR